MSSDSDSGSSSGSARSFLKEYSQEELAGILIIIGVILFFIPDPISTAVGIIILILGIITWFTDWLWG